MEQLLFRGPWEDVLHRKQGEKWFVLSLSNTLLLRLPGWYEITNAVATCAVLKGVSGVAAANAVCPFSKAGVCLLPGPWRGAAWRSVRAQLGISVLWKESFRAGSGFLASKLETVLLIPQRIYEMQEEQGTWRDKNIQVSLANFSIDRRAGSFYVNGDKENSYFLSMGENFEVCTWSA